MTDAPKPAAPHADSLAIPPSQPLILELHAERLLTTAARDAALAALQSSRHWWRWANRSLLFVGAALLLAGVVFFFAYNWARMHHVAKFCLIETGLWICALAALRRGMDKLSGKVLMLSASMLVGVLLAVYGQVYQTGADAFENYVLWAALIFLWVVIARFAALWILWLVVTNVALILFWLQIDAPAEFEFYFGIFLLLGIWNSIALAAREYGAARGLEWLENRWTRHLLWLSVLTYLMIPTLAMVVGEFGHGEVVGAVAFTLTLVTGHVYFRHLRPDFPLVGLNVLAVCIVLLTLVGKLLFEWSDDAIAFLGFGLIVLGVSSVAAFYLRHVAKVINREETVKRHVERTSLSASRENRLPGFSAEARDERDAKDEKNSAAVKKPLRTLRDLLYELVGNGLMDEKDLARIDAFLLKSASESSEPWFVKLLIGLGAWIAAICFVVFLSIANLITEKPPVLLAWAGAFLVGAIVLRNLTRHVFPHQLALAMSVVGHIFAIWCAVEVSPRDADLAVVAITTVSLCIFLYPLFRDSLHQFLSCSLALACLTAWIVNDAVWPLIHVEMLAKIVVIGVVFMYRPDLRVFHPLGYAMALSVPASLFMVLLPEDVLVAPWWPANVVLAIALIWLYQWAAGGWRHMRSEPLILAAVATMLLAGFTTPGILAAIGLLVLGYARGNQHLTAIGILFFPICIVVFYYEWQISLLIKSWMMAGSGAMLLAARQTMNLRSWARESIA